jgi:hypothetical protein
MPRQAKLKVYRLTIGFHDAYVAAPSQKAAIEAWGSDKDVFQRKQAELVEDPKLAKEPLASPGTVIKRLRGTAAEQMAALGKTEPAPRRRTRPARDDEPKPKARPSLRLVPKAAPPPPPKPKPKPKPAPKPKPRPSRTALDQAEQALVEAEARHQKERRKIVDREAELARERKALEKKQAGERERLEARRDKAQAAYDTAIQRWRAS